MAFQQPVQLQYRDVLEVLRHTDNFTLTSVLEAYPQIRKQCMLIIDYPISVSSAFSRSLKDITRVQIHDLKPLQRKKYPIRLFELRTPGAHLDFDEIETAFGGELFNQLSFVFRFVTDSQSPLPCSPWDKIIPLNAKYVVLDHTQEYDKLPVLHIHRLRKEAHMIHGKYLGFKADSRLTMRSVGDKALTHLLLTSARVINTRAHMNSLQELHIHCYDPSSDKGGILYGISTPNLRFLKIYFLGCVPSFRRLEVSSELCSVEFCDIRATGGDRLDPIITSDTQTTMSKAYAGLQFLNSFEEVTLRGVHPQILKCCKPWKKVKKMYFDHCSVENELKTPMPSKLNTPQLEELTFTTNVRGTICPAFNAAQLKTLTVESFAPGFELGEIGLNKPVLENLSIHYNAYHHYPTFEAFKEAKPWLLTDSLKFSGSLENLKRIQIKGHCDSAELVEHENIGSSLEFASLSMDAEVLPDYQYVIDLRANHVKEFEVTCYRPLEKELLRIYESTPDWATLSIAYDSSVSKISRITDLFTENVNYKAVDDPDADVTPYYIEGPQAPDLIRTAYRRTHRRNVDIGNDTQRPIFVGNDLPPGEIVDGRPLIRVAEDDVIHEDALESADEEVSDTESSNSSDESLHSVLGEPYIQRLSEGDDF